MPLIQHVYPWDSQPQEAAGINPTLRGVVDVWVGSQPSHTALRGTQTIVSGVSQGVGSAGRHALMSSWLGSHINLGAVDHLFPSSTLTIAVFRRSLDTVARSSLLFGSQTSSARVAAHAPWSDGVIYFDVGDVSNGRIAENFGAKVTTPETLVFVAGPTKGREIWRAGARLAKNGDTFQRGADNSEFRLGAGVIAGADDEEIYLMVISSVEWTDEEIIAWNRDPYGQTFAPRTQYIPTSSGAPVPTLGTPTFVPGSLTSSGFRPRFPVTWA